MFSVAFLIRAIRWGFTDKETFKQRLEGDEGNSCAVFWRKMVPGKSPGQYDAPEVTAGLACSWTRQSPGWCRWSDGGAEKYQMITQRLQVAECRPLQGSQGSLLFTLE